MKYTAQANVTQDAENLGELRWGELVGPAVELPPDQSATASEPQSGNSTSGEKMHVHPTTLVVVAAVLQDWSIVHRV